MGEPSVYRTSIEPNLILPNLERNELYMIEPRSNFEHQRKFACSAQITLLCIFRHENLKIVTNLAPNLKIHQKWRKKRFLEGTLYNCTCWLYAIYFWPISFSPHDHVIERTFVNLLNNFYRTSNEPNCYQKFRTERTSNHSSMFAHH